MRFYIKYVYRFAYANATLNSLRFSAYQSRPKRAIQSNAPACKKRLNQELPRQFGGFLMERAAIGRQASGRERGESVCVNKEREPRKSHHGSIRQKQHCCSIAHSRCLTFTWLCFSSSSSEKRRVGAAQQEIDCAL